MDKKVKKIAKEILAYNYVTLDKDIEELLKTYPHYLVMKELGWALLNNIDNQDKKEEMQYIARTIWSLSNHLKLL